MSRDLDDLVALLGIGIIGGIAYNAWYKGQPIDAILGDIDTKLRALLDDIATKLPALPPLPSFTPPQFPLPQQQQAPAAPVPPPAEPDKEETQTQNTPAASTNTIPDENSSQPDPIEPEKKPKDSGQLPTNPSVPAPPAGSGGAIVAFAGDFTMNDKAVQTVQVMKKHNVSFIIGAGDYAYTGSAADWFNKVITPEYKGKIVGAIGNHDNDSYKAVFNMTSWNSAHKVAPHLTVVTIDTEKGIDANTLDSLTKAAKSQSAHVAYVMHKAYVTASDGHHPPSENKWGSVIDSVAKKYGVKLVVAGHNHNYEHFTCNGIHYVTAGAAGRKFYQTSCKSSCSPVKCINSKNGFLKVAVSPTTLLCQFIENTTGAEQDSFQVSAGSPAVAANRYVYPTARIPARIYNNTFRY